MIPSVVSETNVSETEPPKILNMTEQLKMIQKLSADLSLVLKNQRGNGSTTSRIVVAPHSSRTQFTHHQPRQFQIFIPEEQRHHIRASSQSRVAFVSPMPQIIEPHQHSFEIDQMKIKMNQMEEMIKAMQGFRVEDSVDLNSMCLVPDVWIPPEFKIPEFDKYSGITCPKAYLTKYCRRMAPHVQNEKLMMHIFQESLFGSAEHWYNSLNPVEIRSWQKMADAFVRYHAYNLYFAPTIEDAKKQAKKSTEGFRSYALRWRNFVVEIRPPLAEKEMAPLFISTMTGTLLDKLIPYMNSSFAKVVVAGENIENLLKEEKIIDPEIMLHMLGKLSKGVDTSYEEDEVYMMEAKKLQTKSYSRWEDHHSFVNNQIPFYHALPAPPQYQTHQQPSYSQRPDAQSPTSFPQCQNTLYLNHVHAYNQRSQFPLHQRPPRPPKNRTPLPVSLELLYVALIAENKIIRRPTRIWNPIPSWYDSSKACDFHSQEISHNIFMCPALLDTIENLIQQGILKFQTYEVPNANTHY